MSTQFNIKTDGVWKKATGYHIKHDGIWKPIQNAYVKVAGSWKQYYPSAEGITMVINAVSIDITYGTTKKTIINPNLGASPSALQYQIEYANWYNLDIGAVLTAAGMNLDVPKLTIISNGGGFGGRHGKIVRVNGYWDLDTSLRTKYALTIGEDILAQQVDFKYQGSVNIVGFGGNALENEVAPFVQFVSKLTPTSPPNTQPPHLIASDILGVSIYGYFDTNTNSSKSLVYGQSVNIYDSSGYPKLLKITMDTLMAVAKAYFDMTDVEAYMAATDNSELGRYKTYLDVFTSSSVLLKFIAFRNGGLNLGIPIPLNTYPRFTFGSDYEGNPMDGGHALRVGKNVTFIPGVTSPSLTIAGGLPGGFIGIREGQTTNQCDGGYGGLGLPYGVGSLPFIGYYKNGVGPLLSNNKFGISGYNAGKMRYGSNIRLYMKDLSPYVNQNADILYSGNYGYPLSDIHRTTPGLEYKYWHCYSTQNRSGAHLSDFSKAIGGDGVVPINPGTITNIPIIGRLNLYSHNKRKSDPNNHIATPGLAINRTGGNITFAGSPGTYRVVGYELYRGDGTDASHWVP